MMQQQAQAQRILLLNETTTDDTTSIIPIPLLIPVSTLTDTQEKILAILPILPSLLSIFGSLTIVHMVLTSQRKMTPYKRLLLGMSICDTIFSLSVPLWPFLLPQDTSHRIWANGTNSSCTVMGFFSQFTFAGILYNGMLSFYYLLTVRFGYKDPQMTNCIEPFMHILSIGFPIITAIIGASFGFYAEVEIGAQCWVDDYPRGCGTLAQDGQSGSGEPCLSPTIGWIFGGWVIFFVIFSIIINNIIIYRFVKRTITIGRRRTSTFQHGQNSIHDSQTRRVQAVATQGFLYVTSFVLSYTWPIIIRIIEGTIGDASWESTLFPIMILNSIFMPLQGFFNLLVYVRPNYLRVRREHIDETKLWCFRRALHGNVIKPEGSKIHGTSNSRMTGSNTAFFISKASRSNSESFFFSRSSPSFLNKKKTKDRGGGDGGMTSGISTRSLATSKIEGGGGGGGAASRSTMSGVMADEDDIEQAPPNSTHKPFIEEWDESDDDNDEADDHKEEEVKEEDVKDDDTKIIPATTKSNNNNDDNDDDVATERSSGSTKALKMEMDGTYKVMDLEMDDSSNSNNNEDEDNDNNIGRILSSFSMPLKD